MTDSVSVPSGRKVGGRLLGFWLWRQGAAVWIGILLFLFFILFNPHAQNAVEGALWMFIPMLFIFGFYLGITQMLPVITAPVFESHFAPLKDIAVSIWTPLAIVVAGILSAVRGVELFGIDVDMTKVEMGIAAQMLFAFGLDILFGSVFTTMKNRLATEAGMGRMPG